MDKSYFLENTMIWLPAVMIYLIAVLEQSDFTSIRCEMAKGTVIDSLVAGTAAIERKGKKR